MKATIGQRINKRWDIVREFAPSLLLLRATLRPFDDVIVAETAGPQPAGTDGDPYFEIMVNDPSPRTRVALRFRGEVSYVEIRYWVERLDKPGLWEQCGRPVKTSLSAAYDYLRQLPRSVHSFRRRSAR